MSDTRVMDIEPISEAGDIPWGMIKEKQLLPDRSWYSPQGRLDAVGAYEKEMKAKGQGVDPQEILRLSNARKMNLERVGLANGLRYAVIRDAETGEEAFDDHQYCGLISCDCGAIHDLPAVTSAGIIRDTDLGGGYKLKMMVAGKGTGRERPMSESFVEKKFTTADETTGLTAEHSFHYQVDPQSRHFGGRYNYRSGRESSSIWLKTEFDKAREAFKQRLSYDVCIADIATNNQINFLFGSGGQLEEIQLAGRNFLGMEGAEPELLAFTADTQRGVVGMTGEELKSPRAKTIVRRLLGVEYGDSLTLDTKGTLSKFIQNADSAPHKNPREVMAFVGATRTTGWQPALLEGVAK